MDIKEKLIDLKSRTDIRATKNKDTEYVPIYDESLGKAQEEVILEEYNNEK